METTCTVKLPPANYRRTIEELSLAIPDPALKLKFLKQALNEYQKISGVDKPNPEIADIDFRQTLLDNREKIWPCNQKAGKNIIHEDVISAPPVNKLWPNKLRYAVASAIILFLTLWIGIAVSPLKRGLELVAVINSTALKSEASHRKIIIRKRIIYSRPSNVGKITPLPDVKPAEYRDETGQILRYLQNPVLADLTPLKAQNDALDLTAGKPLLSSQPHTSEKYSSKSGIESEVLSFQKETGWLPEYLRNPILLALVPQKTQDAASDFYTGRPILSSKPPAIENHSLSTAAKSEKLLNETVQGLKYLQNPIMLALTPLETDNPKTDPIFKKPLSSFQLAENQHRSLPTNGESEKSFNETVQGLKYFQNPILLALAPQQTDNSKMMDRISNKPLSSSQTSESENRPFSTAAESDKLLSENGQYPRYLRDPILLAPTTSSQTNNAKTGRISNKPLTFYRASKNEKHGPPPVEKTAKYIKATDQFPEYLEEPIWMVEKTPDREIYSNRLQIITTYTISNEPREYYRLPKTNTLWPSGSESTDKISGIVYHASESDVYPFMPEMNHSILKYSKQLIKYLIRNKSYHFFIDRFGRVYRLVREDHAAFHAGNSIWADDEEIYLNLNHAFIGICFEGKDFEEIRISKQKRGQASTSKSTLLKPTGISSFNEAQLRSGKELTDWLRVKYKISQHNCVPHALISVNPDKMLIGWHLDLSQGFPFAKFGLSDKYREPLPSMVEFGFFYDRYFEKIFNGNLWQGIRWSEEILHRQARNSGMSFAEYRTSLHQKFFSYTEWEEYMLGNTDHIEIKTQKSMGNENRLSLGKR